MSLREPLPPNKSPSRRAGVGRTELERGAWIHFEPNWLHEDSAQRLLSLLVEQIAWCERSIRLFGRTVLQPRLIAWAGELPYRYSGQTLPPQPRPRVLDEVWHRVEAFAGASFNHLLLNRYRDGNDSMGWHSDDEPELGREPLLASLSLGVTRRFVVRPKQSDPGVASHYWLLDHGSLLIMGGSLQHHYRHRVPRQRVDGQRVNLTFRYLLSAPALAK